MIENVSVCYFGAYRSNYPRNLTIRRALELADIPVTQCQVSPRYRNWQRWLSLIYQFLRQPTACKSSVIIVAEFCHTLVPLAWMLSRFTGASLVFDPGISFYDEMILSQKSSLPDSLRAHYLWWVDSIAFALSDMIIWFTPVDEDHFGGIYHIPTGRATWLPPGVDSQGFGFFPPLQSDSPFIVHWDGSFIASHGVEVILGAADLLRNHNDIRFELAGDGPLAKEMHEYANSLRLDNVTFLGKVPFDDLVESVKRAHVCLGAFRADDKQRRSLYTKELQAMMAGRALITADGEAKRRVFVPGESLILIPPHDPQALADEILKLKADAGRRRELGERGHTDVASLCSPQSIQHRLIKILYRSLENRHH